VILLALDTSGPSGSAALLRDDRVLAETVWFAKASHSAELPVQIQKICGEADTPLDRVAAFAVTIGPGSFTGLRVGLSFVKGLALTSARPVAGVSTLAALAFPVREEGALCPLLDARHDEIYGAVFQETQSGLIEILPEKASPPRVFFEDAKKYAKETNPFVFFGSGARRYENEIRGSFGSEARFLDPSRDLVLAANVGRLGRALIERGVAFEGGTDLKPNYLRASEPEIRKGKVFL